MTVVPSPLTQEDEQPVESCGIKQGDSGLGNAGSVRVKPSLYDAYRLLPLRPGAFRRVVVVDIETTGFSNNDEVIEIGAVEFELQEQEQSAYSSLVPSGTLFHTLLASERSIHPEAAKVNSLSAFELRQTTPRSAGIRRFARFLGNGAAVVAHNASFDIRFLRAALRSEGVDTAAISDEHVFCTRKAFRETFPNNYEDLDSVCYRLGISEGAPGSPFRQSHSALIDAMLTAKVLVELVHRVMAVPIQKSTLISMPCRLHRKQESNATGIGRQGTAADSQQPGASPDCSAPSQVKLKELEQFIKEGTIAEAQETMQNVEAVPTAKRRRLPTSIYAQGQ